AVAIRPEKIRIGRQPPAHAPVNAAEGEIWDIGYLGDMTVFHIRLKDGKVVKASSLNAVRAVEDPLGYDQQVWISFGDDAGVVLKD
ncbi:TOBE domain-containing protein, partial [Sinorhizobium meliloti]